MQILNLIAQLSILHLSYTVKPPAEDESEGLSYTGLLFEEFIW
jgi:hypothetical protein